MTRRILTLVLAVALAAMGASALAEYTWYGTMMVDNCDAWVSLRDGPGTGCKRLAKVPLYAIVTDAEWEPICGDFIYCNYDGQWGYILAEYLTPWSDPEPDTTLLLDETLKGLHVLAERTYIDEGEYLFVSCDDAAMNRLWYYESRSSSITELDQTAAFLAGPAQDPMVIVYNAEEDRMTALDLISGEVRWQLTDPALGAGNCWTVSGDGTIYFGGYYGPDPVAIDAWGNVRWRADSQGCYWLYELWIESGRLLARYDVMDGDHDHSGIAVFSLDGALLEKRYD